jgi:hypothetical protein
VTDQLTAPVDDRCTAAHELGHAFALRAAGLTADRLVVRRIMGGGWCTVKEEFIQADQLWDYAVGLAAGRAAEEIYREDTGLGGPWSWGTSGDEELFAALFVPRGEESYLTEGSWSQALGDARSLLTGEWLELEPLILPLARSGTLHGIPA